MSRNIDLEIILPPWQVRFKWAYNLSRNNNSGVLSSIVFAVKYSAQWWGSKHKVIIDKNMQEKDI